MHPCSSLPADDRNTNPYSSGYDVLEGSAAALLAMASISFHDREELSWMENARNFRLTAFLRYVVTVLAISALFSAEAVGLPCDLRVPQ